MMEGPDLVTEFFGDIDHLGHLVGAITMIVHEDISAEDFGQCLQAQVACRGLAFARRVPGVPFSAVAFSLNPGRTITRDVTHARRGPPRLIDAFWVLAAGHLQSIFRSRKFHSLYGPRRNQFEDYTAPTDQVS